MGRIAKPEVQRFKEQIIKLTHEEAAELSEWLSLVVEIREEDRAADEARRKRRAATVQTPNLGIDTDRSSNG